MTVPPGAPSASPTNQPPELDAPSLPDDGPNAQQTVENLGGSPQPGATPPTVSEAEEALRWALEDVPTDGSDLARKWLRVNVGTSEEFADDEHRPRWLRIRLQAVEDADITKIRTGARNRAEKRRGGGSLDETDINCRVIAKSIIHPDLEAIAREKGVQPQEWVRRKFSHKPGLITQIVGEVYGLSGYDDADLEDVGQGGD